MMEADLTAHLSITCLGTLACVVFIWLLQIRTAGLVKSIWLSLTIVLLGAALGMLFAKGVYYLLQIEHINGQGVGDYFISYYPKDKFKFFEQLSFFGGVIGFILGVFFSARIFNLPPRKVLNCFAPAGAALIALFRFAEYYLGEFGLQFPEKIGLTSDTILPFPWMISIDVWGDGDIIEYYLPIFLYEGFVAAAAGVIALICIWDRDCFIRTLFYICLAQVLLESIRNYNILLLFVKPEQLMCFLYVEGVLVFYAVRRFRQRKWYGILSPLLGLLVAGVVVMIEFELQNKHFKIESFFAKFGLQNTIAFMKELGAMKLYIIMASALATLGIADIVHHIVGYRMKKRPALQ